MKFKEFKSLPKGDPDKGKVRIGTRFRSKDSDDTKYQPGQTICLYEVISITEQGYEYATVWEKLEKDE